EGARPRSRRPTPPASAVYPYISERPLLTARPGRRRERTAGRARDLPGAGPHHDPLPVSGNDHSAHDLRWDPHLLHHGPDVVEVLGLPGRGDHRQPPVSLELREHVADALAVRAGLRGREAALAIRLRLPVLRG